MCLECETGFIIPEMDATVIGPTDQYVFSIDSQRIDRSIMTRDVTQEISTGTFPNLQVVAGTTGEGVFGGMDLESTNGFLVIG